MGNSDSESGSECFESAEESLDQDDEPNNFKIQPKKSENKVVTLVSSDDNVDSVHQIKRGISGNSLSYRKRPEGVKRLLSNTTTKSTPKASSSEVIFKANEIVPDAFFQDITNNLSKNINKSISTLQQKSSNVKDLIFSSLPVPSANDNKGFCYDELSSTLSNKEDIPGTEFHQVFQSNLKSEELVPNVTEKNRKEAVIKRSEEDTEEELIKKKLLEADNGNELKKSPDFRDDNLKTDFDEKLITLSSALVNDLQNIHEKNNLKVSNDIYSNTSEVKEIEPKNSQKCENAHSESISTEISVARMETKNEEINDVKLVYDSETLKKENEGLEISENKSNELTENIISKKNENPECVVFSEPMLPNKSHIENSNLALEDTKSSISFAERNINDYNFLAEEKNNVESNSNVEELKKALESIVKEDKINLQNITQNTNKPVEEDISFQKEIQTCSNDGWDDFDFSDNEVESTSKTYVVGENLIEEQNKEKIKKIALGTNSLITEKENKAVSKNFCGNSKKQEDIKYENKLDLNMSKNSQQSTEPGSGEDDFWDWNNWDDTPEVEGEKTEIVKTQKPENKQQIPMQELEAKHIKDDSSNIGNWTGWDTFAQKPQEKQGFSLGLRSWGVDMLFNKATAVTQGISNVFEAGLGAPDPETLARMEKLEKENFKEQVIEKNEEHFDDSLKRNSVTNAPLFPVSGITSLVAGVTSKIVEHSKIQEIGSKVITGGLDTLETFGKKTMEVLQEGDPGLKNKRALLTGNNKIILSQMLREAKEKAEREMKKAEEKDMTKRCHFETLFDDFQGMVHLEALEMLSKQCQLKLEQIRCEMNSEEQEDFNGILEEVEQLCALDECDLEFKSSVLDFKTALQMSVQPLKSEISLQKILQIHDSVSKWLQMSSESKQSPVLINQKLVSTLAELTAATVQQFHKSGELLSVKECRKTVEEVDALSRLTNLLCKEINSLCEKFISLSCDQTSEEKDSEKLNSEKVATIMKDSTAYIRQAFDLLIPVIQLGAAV